MALLNLSDQLGAKILLEMPSKPQLCANLETLICAPPRAKFGFFDFLHLAVVVRDVGYSVEGKSFSD
jgi:hypothetical protein